MRDWDASRGLRYARLTALKLAALYAAVMILCILALDVFCDVANIESDPLDLVSESTSYALPFIPLLFIAFVTGGFAPGDHRRMLMRLVMSLYLVAVILLVTGDLSYSLQDIEVSHESGAVVDSTSLEITAVGFAGILILIPVLSAIDSILEWKEKNEETLLSDR